jgi:AraC-like DNA-binding protein
MFRESLSTTTFLELMTSLQNTDILPDRRNNGFAAPTHLHQHQSAFIDQIYGLLNRHLDYSLVNVDWLADQLEIPRRTLYRRVKSHVQLTPIKLIRQCRLQKAVELLRAGHTVTDTAYLTGFSTPSHFITVFRQCYQQTPTKYMSTQII